MNLIISTCGTSVLTNLDGPAVRNLIARHANENSEDVVNLDDRRELLELIETAKSKLAASDHIATKLASAELNGILSLAGDQTPLDSKDVYILIHTDTWLGISAAKIVAEKLESYGIQPQLECIPSLNTRSRADFDDGLRNLVTWAADSLPGYRDSKYRVLFNLVGGFKSVQGFMQTLGMFYADEIVYIFETGGELLRIPRLPVDLDASARDIMTRHANTFRRLDTLGAQPAASIPPAIPESLLYSLEAESELSPWGKLLWNAFRDSLYKTKLLEAPSDRIRFTDDFRSDSRNVKPDRLSILNQRIDDLVRYVESPDKPNLKRLDVKQLKGNPKPPSTHEADAWADADCRRIYFHYDNNVAVLDRLEMALHK